MKFVYNLIIVLLFCVSSFADVRDSGTRFMETAIKPYIESGECVGAISILYDNGVQESTCLGWANREEKRAIAMNQSFMQCSQTKGFCGVTVAILIEEGKISLDDPIGKYLPEFKNPKVAIKDEKGNVVSLVDAKTPITIRMLMNHTSGVIVEVPTKLAKGWPSISLRETALEAAKNHLLFEPATKVQYSNAGIDVAAAIVEVVTKKPWDVFLKERVLEPLEMKDTTFNPTDEHLKNSISLYQYAKGKKPEFILFRKAMPLPHNGSHINASAGGGAWTTALDQLKFYKMLMNLGVGENGARILKEETVKNLFATSTRPKEFGKYSLGIFISDDGWFGHGGAWGTRCFVNWQKKQLKLWVTQGVDSKYMTCNAIRDKTENEFFKSKASANIDEYTGRMK